MKYLPFLTGTYSVAPALIPMSKMETAYDKLVFQVDSQYADYLDNKAACRKENIHKYYCTGELREATIRRITNYITIRLQDEHPAVFELDDEYDTCFFSNSKTGELLQWNKTSLELDSDGKYLSLFDALCCQVQEDFAVCQLTESKDWLAAIHLCAPNHWAAEDKIGKPFDAVHQPVPGMGKSFVDYFKMLQAIVQDGCFTRYAWGISTDMRLNHHPVAPSGIDEQQWQGRRVEEDTSLYIRTERQNLIGFPEVNAFLFTITHLFLCN